MKDHVERIFLFGIMWSFGALLELPDRILMQNFLKKKFPNLKYPEEMEEGLIFDFLVDRNGKQERIYVE